MPPSRVSGLDVLGWVGREIAYTLFNRSPKLDPEQTGQSAGGVVSGLLNGRDFLGGALTYTGSGTTAKGTVVVDPTTGEYTYTPDAAFAAAGGTDTFVATVSNTATYQLPGLAGKIQGAIHQVAQTIGIAQPDTTQRTVTVTVVINGPTLIGEVRVGGQPVNWPFFSKDGTRAYQTTETRTSSGVSSTLGIVDTVTGNAVGDPITLAGELIGSVQFSADGRRAAFTTESFDDRADTYTTRMVVIDTTTGTVIGSPLVLTGEQPGGVVQLSADGTRVFQTTKVLDESTRTYTTTLRVIDGATGAVVGTPISLGGSPYPPRENGAYFTPLQFNTDGTQAYLTTTGQDSGTGPGPRKTIVAIIDTATGALVGDPTIVDGDPVGPVVLNPDGTRAYRVTTVHGVDTAADSTRVAVIDTATGAVVAAPLSTAGYAVAGESVTVVTTPAVVFSPDGTKAYLTTDIVRPGLGDTTRLVTINAVSGAVIGLRTIAGYASQGLQQSPTDPSRFYQVTVNPGGNNNNTTTVTAINSVDGVVLGSMTIVGTVTRQKLQFSADGTRAFVMTTWSQRPLDLNSPVVTRLGVINTADGTAVGNPVGLWGDKGEFQLGPSGSRGYFTTTENFVVIDPAMGAVVGSSFRRGNQPVGAPQISPDGTRAYLTYRWNEVPTNPNSAVRTGVFAVNTTDGTLLDAQITIQGRPVGPVQYSLDGSRVYVTTVPDGMAETVVSVYNVADGSFVNNWTPLAGQAYSLPVFSSDGTRAYVQTDVYHPDTGNYSTSIAVYDTATGTVIGAPISLNGPFRGDVQLSADGTRVVQTFLKHDPSIPGIRKWTAVVATINTSA